MEIFEDALLKKGRVKVIIIQFHTTEITYHRMYEGPQKKPNLIFFPTLPAPFQCGRSQTRSWVTTRLKINYSHKNRLLHRKCTVQIFIHESKNFRNERVSKVLQRVNKHPYKALSMV